MIRKLLIVLIILCLTFLLGQFLLSAVDEPLKITLWNLLPILMPALGIATIAVAIIAHFAKRFEAKLLIFVALIVGLTSVSFPFLHSEIGRGYPSTIDAASSDIEIRVPLDGEVVVAWGGDRISTNYHAAYPDQRWAYDLVIEPHSQKFASLDDYGCFGETVLAPVDGKIKTASDTAKDEAVGSEGTSGSNVFGNYIVIEPTGLETRLIIAHLKSGSILVQEEQIVSEGQPIAQCGNSGSSTEPHVHIHYIELVKDGDETHMIGLPLYFRDHRGPAMPNGGFSNMDDQEIASGDKIMHKGKKDE